MTVVVTGLLGMTRGVEPEKSLTSEISVIVFMSVHHYARIGKGFVCIPVCCP